LCINRKAFPKHHSVCRGRDLLALIQRKKAFYPQGEKIRHCFFWGGGGKEGQQLAHIFLIKFKLQTIENHKSSYILTQDSYSKETRSLTSESNQNIIIAYCVHNAYKNLRKKLELSTSALSERVEVKLSSHAKWIARETRPVYPCSWFV
jgi:DNA-binding transcriptional regulator YiaG